jgi:AcrR family transcriptional regulator
MTRVTKTSPNKTAPAPTQERLLDAAAVVFARDGLKAATTREIAHAAGVNEVTLFRLFKNKQNLLSAVLKRVFASSTPDKKKSFGVQVGLAGIVRNYMASYASLLGKNMDLMRVLLGEIQHFQENEIMVIRGIFRPQRQGLIDLLLGAQKAGLARKDVNPAIVADQLGALVFMWTLKCKLPIQKEYTARDYIDACVDTIVRAIEIPAPASKSERRKP